MKSQKTIYLCSKRVKAGVILPRSALEDTFCKEFEKNHLRLENVQKSRHRPLLVTCAIQKRTREEWSRFRMIWQVSDQFRFRLSDRELNAPGMRLIEITNNAKHEWGSFKRLFILKPKLFRFFVSICKFRNQVIKQNLFIFDQKLLD